jgi:hypothetical protein
MAAKVALDQLDSLDDPAKAALEDVMGDLEQVREGSTLASTWSYSHRSSLISLLFVFNPSLSSLFKHVHNIPLLTPPPSVVIYKYAFIHKQSKAALSDNELVTDDNAGSAYIYNFASRVFDRADAIDRAGKATR